VSPIPTHQTGNKINRLWFHIPAIVKQLLCVFVTHVLCKLLNMWQYQLYTPLSSACGRCCLRCWTWCTSVLLVGKPQGPQYPQGLHINTWPTFTHRGNTKRMAGCVIITFLSVKALYTNTSPHTSYLTMSIPKSNFHSVTLIILSWS